VAIYHLSAKVISRGHGKSCVAAAAYRAGERLDDEHQGLTHDFTQRTDVRESWIQAPEGAPAWATDRQELWTMVDRAERRKDAQTARELEIALPRELTRDQQRELIRGFVSEELVARGMVADVAIHEGRDKDNPNPHAHILLTTRSVTPEGFGAKTRDWNKKELLENWREKWEEHANRALERAGREERIDHRSLEAQGIDDRLPQPKLGPAAAALEKKGIRMERGNLVREAGEYRAVVIELAAVRTKKERLLKGARDQQSVFGRRVTAGWSREAAEAVGALEGNLGRLATQKDILFEMERLDREEVTPIRTALADAHKEESHLVASIRDFEARIPDMERHVRAATEAQGQMDCYSGLTGWWRRRHDFPRYVPQGYKQTWQEFRREAMDQIQAGHQAENELSAARATLDQMRQGLPQVQERIKDLETSPVLVRLVALYEAQQRLKPQVVRSRTASGQVVPREVAREDAKPTRALLGVDILLQGLLRATQRADEREAQTQAFYEEQKRRQRQLEQDRGWER